MCSILTLLLSPSPLCLERDEKHSIACYSCHIWKEHIVLIVNSHGNTLPRDNPLTQGRPVDGVSHKKKISYNLMAASVCAGKSIFIVLTPRIQNCCVYVRVCV